MRAGRINSFPVGGVLRVKVKCEVPDLAASERTIAHDNSNASAPSP